MADEYENVIHSYPEYQNVTHSYPEYENVMHSYAYSRGYTCDFTRANGRRDLLFTPMLILAVEHASSSDEGSAT
jgi:hypothetical protein